MRVVIVGSGIVGAAAGYRIAKEGADVVLVDAAVKGQATAAGAGIICPWASDIEDEIWHEIAATAACRYPELVAELCERGQSSLGFRRVGGLRISRDREEHERQLESVRKRTLYVPEAGKVESLAPEEAESLFPPLRANDRYALYVSGASRVDGRRLRNALVRAGVEAGMQVVSGESRLVCRTDRVSGVVIDNERIWADEVVVAAGAWSPGILRPVGVKVAMAPQRGQIVHLSVAPQDSGRWPVILPGPHGHYMLAFEDSRVVVGATRESGSGFDYRVTAGGVAEVMKEALVVAPGLSLAEHVETRVGFRPMGPDVRPLLGRPASLEGVIVATGLGASGLTLGPYVGSLAAELALGVSTPTHSRLTYLDPERKANVATPRA